jgi:hypothetical protein
MERLMDLAVLDEVVPKKPPKPTPAPEPEPKPKAAGQKPMIVQIRGSQEYKEWVEEIAGKDGFSVSMAFDRAMRMYAKANGHREPPKR